MMPDAGASGVCVDCGCEIVGRKAYHYQAVECLAALKAEVWRLREAAVEPLCSAIQLVANDLSEITGLAWEPPLMGLRQIVASIQAEAEARGRRAMREEAAERCMYAAKELRRFGLDAHARKEEESALLCVVRAESLEEMALTLGALPDRREP